MASCGRLEIGLAQAEACATFGASNVGQVGNRRLICQSACRSFREINNSPISNRPQDSILMPHTFPTTELNPCGGSPDPRRAPSPGLSKLQRDPDGRPGGPAADAGV